MNEKEAKQTIDSFEPGEHIERAEAKGYLEGLDQGRAELKALREDVEGLEKLLERAMNFCFSIAPDGIKFHKGMGKDISKTIAKFRARHPKEGVYE